MPNREHQLGPLQRLFLTERFPFARDISGQSFKRGTSGLKTRLRSNQGKAAWTTDKAVEVEPGEDKVDPAEEARMKVTFAPTKASDAPSSRSAIPKPRKNSKTTPIAGRPLKPTQQKQPWPLWGACGAVMATTMVVLSSFTDAPIAESAFPAACGGFAAGAFLAWYLNWRSHR